MKVNPAWLLLVLVVNALDKYKGDKDVTEPYSRNYGGFYY